VILDTNGNIFGGFTPVEWESRTTPRYEKADPSLKSFVFTLKNPHNAPARRFALKAEQKHRAIYWESSSGPDFNDIRVSDGCNANTRSYTYPLAKGTPMTPDWAELQIKTRFSRVRSFSK
jgi:hypothetical protein